MKIARIPGKASSLWTLLIAALLPCAAIAQPPGIELVRTFKGHSEPIYSLALTPDAKRLITGSFDHSVKVWDVASGQLVKSFDGPTAHTKMVTAVAVNHDGRLMASGSIDGAMKFWDVPVKLPPHSDPIPRIALLIGGARFYPAHNTAAFAATADKTGMIRKLTANVIKLPGLPTNVDCLAFHPKNPAIFASGGHDGRIRIYDLTKNAILKEILAHVEKDKVNPIYTIAFSPDGSQILSSSYDRSLKLHDWAAGTLIREFKKFNAKEFPKGHNEEVYAAAFSPDGKLIASGSGGQENVIKIWKTDDGSVVRDLVNPTLPETSKDARPSHPGWIYHVRFLKDGRLVSLGDAPKNHGYIGVWNVADGKLIHGETTAFGSLYGLAISPDEKTIAVGAGNRGRANGDFNNATLLRIPGINQ